MISELEQVILYFHEFPQRKGTKGWPGMLLPSLLHWAEFMSAYQFTQKDSSTGVEEFNVGTLKTLTRMIFASSFYTIPTTLQFEELKNWHIQEEATCKSWQWRGYVPRYMIPSHLWFNNEFKLIWTGEWWAAICRKQGWKIWLETLSWCEIGRSYYCYPSQGMGPVSIKVKKVFLCPILTPKIMTFAGYNFRDAKDFQVIICDNLSSIEVELRWAKKQFLSDQKRLRI